MSDHLRNFISFMQCLIDALLVLMKIESEIFIKVVQLRLSQLRKMKPTQVLDEYILQGRTRMKFESLFQLF